MASMAQRLAVAVKAAVGIFSDRASREAQQLLMGLWPASIGDPPTRGARERLAAYADMPWVYALADKVAFAMASVPWTLSAVKRRGAERATRVKAVQYAGLRERTAALVQLRRAGELVDIEEHPMLDLLDAGNALMTGLAVRKVTALHWDLEGEAFWMKERGPGGVPIRAWPMPPDWVRSTPTPRVRTYRVAFRGWQGEIPETEILWLANPNPSNPYGRGTGLVRALADELETDEYAAKSIRATFLNQSRPDFIVYPKNNQILSEPERVRLEQSWAQQHEGFWRAVRARIASRELGVYEFGQTDFRRLQMSQLREGARDLIRQVWGVPPEIMGIVEPGASRATIQRASYLFARWVLVPRLEMFRALLQERLAPEYDERLIVGYVSPVEDDREFRLEVGRSAPWSLTVDEWRALGDSPTLADGAGERYMVPAGLEPHLDFEPPEPTPPPLLEMTPGGTPLPPVAPEKGLGARLEPDERRVFRRLGVWLAGEGDG